MTRLLPVPALLVVLVSFSGYPRTGLAATEIDELRARIATLESELQRMRRMEREVAELKALLRETFGR